MECDLRKVDRRSDDNHATEPPLPFNLFVCFLHLEVVGSCYSVPEADDSLEVTDESDSKGTVYEFTCMDEHIGK